MKTTSRILLRRSLASVVAAALLVAVLALSLASPAPVQARTAIWSGTMTVGVLTQNTFGFSTERVPGSLDDTTFSHGGANHTIDGIYETGGSLAITNALEFSLADAGLGDVSGLALHAGGKLFDFSDATFDSTYFTYTWTDPGLNWSDGDTVFLEIIGAGIGPELSLVYNPKDNGDGTVAILHENRFRGSPPGRTRMAMS